VFVDDRFLSRTVHELVVVQEMGGKFSLFFFFWPRKNCRQMVLTANQEL
jgi:hypothetical protein